MPLVIFPCSSAGPLGAALAARLGAAVGRAELRRFPDGEAHAEVRERLAGREVVLVQSLAAPGAENLLELLLFSDACRRAAAARVTAVVPYMGYVRQDRTSHAGEALGGAVFARLLSSGSFDRVLTVDLHAAAAEGWFGPPVVHLSAIELLAGALRGTLRPDAVVVSPDLGGAKRADRLARALERPLAIVHKTRQSGEAVVVHRVLGDVRGRAVILADDLIATGGTLVAASEALRAAGCADDISVAATHAVLAGAAVERLAACGIRRLVCSDSVPGPRPLPFETTVVSLAPLLAAELGEAKNGAGR